MTVPISRGGHWCVLARFMGNMNLHLLLQLGRWRCADPAEPRFSGQVRGRGLQADGSGVVRRGRGSPAALRARGRGWCINATEWLFWQYIERLSGDHV